MFDCFNEGDTASEEALMPYEAKEKTLEDAIHGLVRSLEELTPFKDEIIGEKRQFLVAEIVKVFCIVS